MNHPDLHAIIFRHVLTALICDPCARKESRNIHAKGKSRCLPPPSTGEQKPKPCKPSTRAVSAALQASREVWSRTGMQSACPRQWCGSVRFAGSHERVLSLCFAAHDLWGLCFVALLWESLPLPLQRKMATSRGKISHLTYFLNLRWDISDVQTRFFCCCLKKKSPV